MKLIYHKSLSPDFVSKVFHQNICCVFRTDRASLQHAKSSLKETSKGELRKGGGSITWRKQMMVPIRRTNMWSTFSRRKATFEENNSSVNGSELFPAMMSEIDWPGIREILRGGPVLEWLIRKIHHWGGCFGLSTTLGEFWPQHETSP